MQRGVSLDRPLAFMPPVAYAIGNLNYPIATVGSLRRAGWVVYNRHLKPLCSSASTAMQEAIREMTRRAVRRGSRTVAEPS